ncbi:hypothetical protein SAMN05443582_103193 [Phyllobacterium sp. OV277]|nr:hypothetical protein SAMN05443582_103193 [Phyllobacterium sp. OV277]
MEKRGKCRILPEWRRAFAHPLFLEVKSNPDHQLPAGPGSFYFQGDAQWFTPHHVTSRFESKAIAMVGEAYLPDTPAGSVRAASLSNAR